VQLVKKLLIHGAERDYPVQRSSMRRRGQVCCEEVKYAAKKNGSGEITISGLRFLNLLEVWSLNRYYYLNSVYGAVGIIILQQ